MSVLALMYHRTPQEAGHQLDVAMPLFCAQIQALRAANVRFVKFGQALDQYWYGGDTVVSITFDDGHESNMEAIAFLHNAGIPSTSFVVSEFVRFGKKGFMDAAMLKEIGELCEIGAHGASHSDLTSLCDDELQQELSVSKGYLEELWGTQITTMSVPGGKINRRVLRAARRIGFEVVGDSEALVNSTPTLPLHRVCMLNGQSPEHVISMLRAGPMYWLPRRLRRIARSIERQLSAAYRLHHLHRD